jgi:uncharacterized Zn finger protein
MSFDRYPRYTPTTVNKTVMAKSVENLRKKDPDIQPVVIEGRSLANTWWGKSWNQNLESYADYSNRIARGKNYVRSGAVLDLKISKGTIKALVQGSRTKPYSVEIRIDTLSKEKWDKVISLCDYRIDSLEQLLEGRFPKELEVLFVDKKYGLFPSPKEIHFECSCPDWASMCKHVAAVLYGIGARLDSDPLLFFELRDMDSKELLKKSIEKKLDSMLINAGKKSPRQIEDKDVYGIFGV